MHTNSVSHFRGVTILITRRCSRGYYRPVFVVISELQLRAQATAGNSGTTDSEILLSFVGPEVPLGLKNILILRLFKLMFRDQSYCGYEPTKLYVVIYLK
jgi:hypothetical protein